MQAHQDGRRLDRGGLAPEVLPRELLKAELLLGRALPEEVHVQCPGFATSLLEQHHAGRPLEAQQHMAGFDLGALAAGQLDLKRVVGRRQHRADLQIAFFLEQKMHRNPSSLAVDPGGKGARAQTVNPPATSITAPLM